MFKNRFFRKLLHPRVEDIDQVKLIYFLNLVVGQLSALAAAILKNAIHYTHKILTESRIYTTYRELLIQFSEE